MVNKFTVENFKNEVEKSNQKVLVDFYADWCGPCKTMSPIIDEIAEEASANVKIGKVNCDENMELVEKYGIMSIPTILIFKNGNIVKSFLGVTDKQEIENALQQL